MTSYTQELQQLIAVQIQLEFQVSHIYRSFGAFFSHPQVGYPGFSRFFYNEANEEQKHADEFVKYHQIRGGFIAAPAILGYENNLTPINALRKALELEKKVLSNLIAINEIGDPQTQTFIQTYVDIQTNSIAEYTLLLAKASRVESDPAGTYLLDRELQQ